MLLIEKIKFSLRNPAQLKLLKYCTKLFKRVSILPQSLWLYTSCTLEPLLTIEYLSPPAPSASRRTWLD